MASVFLSYDRDDADRAPHFAHALEKAGHEVWWDLHVRGGAQFSKVIEEALKAADVVVVLWSQHSVESAWVRDEATAGRDTGRLVPVTIDGTEPPLGFRQFQTIDLSRWRGRGTPPQLKTLLADVESMAPAGGQRQAPSAPLVQKAGGTSGSRTSALAPIPLRRSLAVAGVIAALLLAMAWWAWPARGGLPVVEVAAADQRSQAAASDLFVKLGTLAQIGQGKWQLVDASSAPADPDFVFRAADSGSPSEPRANLVLLDGKDKSLLWSREFSATGAAQADLRQQMSLTAGRVLGCVLETRANGGLRRDLFKIFLDGCAQLAEDSQNNPAAKAAATMRTVVVGQPGFAPAWARLLFADVDLLSMVRGSDDQPAAEHQLRQDMEQAAKVAPQLPEITIAQTYFLPTNAFAQSLDLLAKAKARAPDSPQVYAEEAAALARVGRMQDSVASARRAAELDPLSPGVETQLIMALAHGGQIEDARRELERAQRLWAGTGALRDAEYGFNLRYGDANVARQLVDNPGADIYARTRQDPSRKNVDALIQFFRQFEVKQDLSVAGFAVQALAEFHQTDDVFRWLAMVPASDVAEAAYVLFRPGLADVRRDPRFMTVAKRIGLVDYWRQSGRWPDFCSDPQLPYDCKAEAAKLAAGRT